MPRSMHAVELGTVNMRAILCCPIPRGSINEINGIRRAPVHPVAPYSAAGMRVGQNRLGFISMDSDSSRSNIAKIAGDSVLT